MFEYKVVVLMMAFYCDGFPFMIDRANHIDVLGLEGWELVSVHQDGDETIGYFKRPIDASDTV